MSELRAAIKAAFRDAIHAETTEENLIEIVRERLLEDGWVDGELDAEHDFILGIAHGYQAGRRLN